MNTEEMLQEVDRRVADGLLEHLLPKAITNHARSRKAFRNCDCDYCKLKWKATSDIGNFKFPSDYKASDHQSIWDHDYEYWEIKKARRSSLRDHYRAKLKALVNAA